MMVHTRNSESKHALTSAEPGRQGGGRQWRREAVSGVERRREIGWAAAEELRGVRGNGEFTTFVAGRANRLVERAVNQALPCRAELASQ